jgi:spore maturation protein CgeB
MSLTVQMTRSETLRRVLGYRKLAQEQLSVLLLDGAYHLHAECQRALASLGHRVTSIAVTGTAPAVLQRLLWALVAHKPDFVLSINQIGFDAGGQIGGVLDALQMPVAVWYVDSPIFVLRDGNVPAAEVSSFFLWERDLIDEVRSRGGTDVHYLPLATDPESFSPGTGESRWMLSYVGNSSRQKCTTLRRRLQRPALKRLPALVQRLLHDRRAAPGSWVARCGTVSQDAISLFEAVTAEGDARYRRGVLRRLAGPELHLFGDPGWKRTLPRAHYGGPLNYGAPVAQVYGRTRVNLNMTSLQMPSAVNQRVFDVPAAGGFLLTDDQPALYELFEPGKEVATYADPAELPDLVRHYAQNETARRDLVERARDRILAQHTYQHRLRSIIQTLRQRHCCRPTVREPVLP